MPTSQETSPWEVALAEFPSSIQFMKDILEQVPEEMGARNAFVNVLDKLAAHVPPGVAKSAAMFDALAEAGVQEWEGYDDALADAGLSDSEDDADDLPSLADEDDDGPDDDGDSKF